MLSVLLHVSFYFALFEKKNYFCLANQVLSPLLVDNQWLEPHYQFSKELWIYVSKLFYLSERFLDRSHVMPITSAISSWTQLTWSSFRWCSIEDSQLYIIPPETEPISCTGVYIIFKTIVILCNCYPSLLSSDLSDLSSSYLSLKNKCYTHKRPCLQQMNPVHLFSGMSQSMSDGL